MGAFFRFLVNLATGTLLGVLAVLLVFQPAPLLEEGPQQHVEIAATEPFIRDTRLILEREEDALIYASFPVTASEAANDAITSLVEARINMFRLRVEDLATDRRADDALLPELNLTFSVPAETGRYIAIRFDHGAYIGRSDAGFSDTIIVDKRTGAPASLEFMLDQNDKVLRLLSEAVPGFIGAYAVAVDGDGSLTVSVVTNDLIAGGGDVRRRQVSLQGLEGEFSDDLRRLLFASSHQSTLPEIAPLPGELPARQPVDCALTKCVALTFDDGPGIYTSRLLDILKSEEVLATFFLVGHRISFHTGDVRRMVLDGHEVGNHSWSHPQLTRLSNEAVKAQTERTNTAIEAVTGLPVTLFRPPYGLFNSRVRDEVDMPIILWDHDTLDWRALNAEVVARRTASVPGAGSIILLHDIHKSTVDAMPRAIANLKAEGYTFVTLSDLFAPHVPVARVVYERRLDEPLVAQD